VNLTKQDLTAIREAFRQELAEKDAHIRLIVREELAEYCPMTDLYREQVPHGVGILVDLGDGQLDVGLREFRKNQFWVQEIRSKSAKYSSSIIVALIGISVLGIVTAIVTGIKTYLTMSGSG
jgi:hypothetical protein